MIIVSIYPGHNAAVCILRDGEVVLNLEMERWSRVKHDFGYREDFVRYCLDRASILVEQVGLVVFNNWGSHLPWPKDTFSSEDYAEHEINFLGHNVKAISVKHHVAHVASAFYTSPFNEAAVLTLDGGGDGENCTLSRCEGNRIVDSFPIHAENIAGWWSGTTMNNYRMPRLHAWDPGSGAGKIMALAAYGKYDADVVSQFERDVQANVYSDKYTDVHGLAFNNDEDLSDSRSSKSQNFAWALQDRTEHIVRDLFDTTYRHFRSDNLCYAGGLALNCIANSRALSLSEFKHLHVPPCPNDTGIALGMALYAWYQYLDRPRTPSHFVPYTGPTWTKAFTQREISSLINRSTSDFGLVAATSDVVSKRISEGSVVAVCRGRSECGPRALGHRSLLARTNDANMRDHINFEVKQREWYRPYAPIVLAEYAHEVFEEPVTDSPYMTGSATIRPEWRGRMMAVCHVDGTTRPQILCRDHDPWLYDVIDEVRKETGIPAVLNTSFNRKAPMVETPAEAIDVFSEMPVKFLVLNDFLVSKV